MPTIGNRPRPETRDLLCAVMGGVPRFVFVAVLVASLFGDVVDRAAVFLPALLLTLFFFFVAGFFFLLFFFTISASPHSREELKKAQTLR